MAGRREAGTGDRGRRRGRPARRQGRARGPDGTASSAAGRAAFSTVGRRNGFCRTSFATLPLFVANYLVGQDLYNNPGDESMKGAHVGLVTGTAVLFGVNTVTGAWNLWEGRKDPNHRKLRMTHGILMIAADVGFLATAALAPESEYESGAISQDPGSGRSTHRAVALTSMGVATFSYLLMLFGGR